MMARKLASIFLSIFTYVIISLYVNNLPSRWPSDHLSFPSPEVSPLYLLKLPHSTSTMTHYAGLLLLLLLTQICMPPTLTELQFSARELLQCPRHSTHLTPLQPMTHDARPPPPLCHNFMDALTLLASLRPILFNLFWLQNTMQRHCSPHFPTPSSLCLLSDSLY